LIRYDPPAPGIGFGIAALIMSALTVSLMVVLPSELEQDGPALALRADPNDAAAGLRSAALHLRCTVPVAVNAPLFSAARVTRPDPRCGQRS
jgi:hypothetical protein